MNIVPRLPDNAPFSSVQRAWLDGYLACVFLDDVAPLPATAAMPSFAREPEPEPEDLPWHDPLLSLDERLEMAAGHKPQHVLMAAMAQLDCGQCGYFCETYAAAITSGAEPSLTRCVPGGKATSRKLKELIAEIGAGSVGAPVAAKATIPTAPAVPVPQQEAVSSAAAPLQARLRQAVPLHATGAEKDTRHVVLDATDGELHYEVGDSLGIKARNDPGLVAAIIECLGASPDTPVQSPDGVERPLIEALSEACEIRRISDEAVEVLASRAHDREESRILQAMAEGYPGVGPDNADLLDLLEAFPSARPPLSELISALDPLLPRLYSIASSPKATPREVHLAVGVVRYKLRARDRGGVASTFLSDRLPPGNTVPVYISKSESFRLPASDKPVIMIGPGTGIAPFRAFLEERQATGAKGHNWLFFGNQRRAQDFLFEDELTGYCRDGLLTRLDTAFSRDQAHKIYVQHRMLENASELWAWLEDGAYLYVCGDAEKMARDVDRGLTYIIAKEGHMDAAGAKAYLARLAREGRYLRDVY
ncbi:MAG: sulfite reductase subunit alpha [Bradyrhizobium sp.]|uniref:sulfite reductase subunit alpha n=1 Tax=Bradyrhizobium sp. TaxID=376 RepID=UPI001DAD53C0|nr:sulfite reductase subunit alpha [Bradyrhizobium sp.]MBV9561971.1 sulfite reductase subunit alpha [Bradyrhizobium sp.]